MGKVLPEDRPCTKCGKNSPEVSFYRDGKYRKSWCRVCETESSLKWQRENREAHLEKCRGWNREHGLERKYGITREDKRQLLVCQGNRCKICKKALSNLSSAHVDHCHQTRKIRGLLCGPCNRLLGLAQDDPEILYSAVAYLSAS